MIPGVCGNLGGEALPLLVFLFGFIVPLWFGETLSDCEPADEQGEIDGEGVLNVT